LQPVDLVVDHSVQIDVFGSAEAYDENVRYEYERNGERYRFLKWGQKAFDNFRVVPPGMGIVHQVNLEYLARVVWTGERAGRLFAYPDTLVGTDSHTTMINGLGVLGWGVGGIEAEAAMLGQPISMLIPQVVGFRLTGELREGVTATDLVLTITEILRRHSVVGKFVEYFGDGIASLGLAHRATIANMSPEYGATMGFFPVDQETLRYMQTTGRDAELTDLVRAYLTQQGLFWTPQMPEAEYSQVLELDISSVEPSLAGPRRPQDRIPLPRMKDSFQTFLKSSGAPSAPAAPQAAATTATAAATGEMDHGAVVIAAITSCTNTSNPEVLIAAGLLARNAVERGLSPAPWVKTSLAPGSRVVMKYLKEAGLLPYLETLGFHLVGFGCTTCIGNSGPLPDEVAGAVRERNLVAAAVLSGNRNFEGRIHPLVRANYLASPPLVVAFALAGRVDIDLDREPLGKTAAGEPVYLRDIWPSREEVLTTAAKAREPRFYRDEYARVFEGTDQWREMNVASSKIFPWEEDSTYLKRAPYFDDFQLEPPGIAPVRDARVLCLLADSVTTDHISPAGTIPPESPAGQYLQANGVAVKDFNSYGSRRGNHEVMVRGTFGNIRLRNLLVPGVEGGRTLHLPGEEEMWIYEAAMRYAEEGVPLLVIAGKEYGTGSSRDWAAKGTLLLGVRAVLAESYERIHRSNLIGMGVLPLQFLPDEGREALGLTGRERYTIDGLEDELKPGQRLTVRAARPDGEERRFAVVLRIDTPQEMESCRHGGILPYVLRRLVVTG
ncbi:MAG: aconitate hydratase AcnA, partial [Candidatus Eisenbacteria bacterium]|nr:aconitate hydratase AcnA [Candidatus Eisenbacteria bacterium]